MRRRTLGLLAAMLMMAAPASAQNWPTKPIHIVVTFAPGGAADIWARIIAEHLSKALGQSVVIENRGGGGGIVASAQVARAEPDGTTILMGGLAPQILAQAIAGNAGFDALRDFTHIAYIGGPPTVFVANPALNVRSLAELAARARAETIDFVSPGVGTLGHLMVEEFARQAGIKLQHIPHKGAAQAMLDIIAGNVPFGSMTWSSAVGQIRAGKVIPLAVSSKARVPEFPDVPTLAELGYPDLVANTWYALSGPAGVPDDIVRKLNRAVAQILELPDVRQRLDQDAVEREPMTPEELTAFITREVARWGPVARKFVRPQ
jgi:tripartite-type tricarboxylate transporter receptor subunit TctC